MKKDYDSTRIYRNTQKKGASQTYDTPSSFILIVLLSQRNYFLLIARSIATAIATVAPTIGLLPIPRKPIIST